MELLVQALWSSVQRKGSLGLETSYSAYSTQKNNFLSDNKIQRFETLGQNWDKAPHVHIISKC